MAKAKWLPPKYRGRSENGIYKAYTYERENDYPIQWNVSNGLKRECVASCCGSLHPNDFYGDCRNDTMRFMWDEVPEEKIRWLPGCEEK